MASFFLDNSTGKRYSVGVAQVEYDGRIYVRPTAATYNELGLSEVTIQPRPDDRFYIVTGPDNTGAYDKTNRPLADLKTQWVAKEKDTCNKTLSQTDWLVIRAAEGGKAIPANIATFRTGCHTTCDANETAINAVKTVAKLEALVNAPATVSNDDGETYTENPDAHLDSYPEQP